MTTNPLTALAERLDAMIARERQAVEYWEADYRRLVALGTEMARSRAVRMDTAPRSNLNRARARAAQLTVERDAFVEAMDRLHRDPAPDANDLLGTGFSRSEPGARVVCVNRLNP